ncbi:MAG: translocation/assembly module TamB domain-containing protein [Colwellia sp.]|nr:translocation/assembly module TamB domain-containing protein [Colwellia sp.]
MIFRRFSLTIAKYLAILLCLLALLLTTPWGTRLTLAILNNFDALEINYSSGSLVRDIKLNSFHLQLDNLEIAITGLSAEIDFSCSLKKTLCIKSLIVDDLFLRYQTIEQQTHQENPAKTNKNQLFEMPFAINANTVVLKNTQLNINNTEISVEQFVTQLTIKKSAFNISQPKAKQLTVVLKESIKKRSIKSSTQLPEVILPIALKIEQLHLDDIVVKTKEYAQPNCQLPCQPKFKQQWQSSNNHLSGFWQQSDVSIRQFKTSTATFSISELVADAKLLPPYQVDSQLVSKLNNVLWWPEVSGSSQQISLQGSFEDLTIKVISEGKLILTSEGNVNLLHSDVPFDFSLAVKEIPMPLSLAHFGQPSSMSLAVSGNLKEQALTLTSQLNSYGYKEAQVKLVASHHEGIFSINELLFNDDNSASQLTLHGEVAILPSEVSWQLSCQSTGFTLPTISLHSLSELGNNPEQINMIAANIPEFITGRLNGNLSSTGSWSENKWSIAINDTNISGVINNSKLSIVGDIGLNDTGHLQKGQLFLAFNDSELSLQTTNDSFWNINGKLSVSNVDSWVKGMAGALVSDFSVTGQQDNPIIQLNSQFSQLNWQHWQSSLLTFEANYQPMNGHQIQLNLNNKHLTMIKENQLINIDDFVFSINGNANKHQIQSHWAGDFNGQLSIDGQLNDDFTYWQSWVNKAAFTYQDMVLTTNKAFSWGVDLTKQQSVIASHCWLSEGISLCMPNQSTVGAFGDVALKLKLDFSVIDQLLLPKGVELNSQISGDVKATWSDTLPARAEANFSLSSGYIKVTDDFSEHQLSQWAKGELAFTVNEQQVTGTLHLADIQDNSIIDINSTLGFPGAQAVDAQIVLNQFNLQPFQAILSDVVNLQGSLTANITINGTLDSPLINGGVTLENGKLLLSQNANTFDNIYSTVVIKNNQANIQGSFFLEDKEASLSGTMSWQENLTMNLNLNADDLPLVFPPQLVMSISPRLNFNLKDKALTVSGSIDVLSGSYNIEKLPEGSVSLSDDVIIVDQHGKAIFKESSGFDIKTDIRVNIAKAFKISGQGLKSHLFGQLQISQKEKQPFQLFGRIQSDQGTFQAYGQRLEIEKGELTFNGPIDNPYFNLRASRHIKAEDIDVGIQVTGLADSLDMQLYSSTTMEMPEMLSYLVRGRSLDASTGNSTAAASLLVGFGVTNSVGLFDQIEKIPLISNIAVDTEGEGDQTQATVSGYIGNRVYLKYGIGVYEPINELTVRMYMFNRFWLEIVSGIEQSTDLYYSFDID